ncbi:hypothetical protein DFH28DRAFT_1085079 [Melampsora americana]|nr:hypothetical protein DFH28DRAFT_1085079 [Melampsora americana]
MDLGSPECYLDQLLCLLDTFKGYLNSNLFYRHERFDLSKIPDLSGRVAIVTGGNTGLGYASCLELVRHGAKVYMASRNESKAKLSILKIQNQIPNAKIEFLQFDLTILSSAKNAAIEFMKKETQLDLLINNAGAMMTPYELSPDGIEIQACNTTGHFALTIDLLPILIKTSNQSNSNVRIINVTSMGHYLIRKPNLLTLDGLNSKSLSRWGRYKTSKLTNILFNNELQKRLNHTKIICLTVHPGLVYTDVFRNLFPTRSQFDSINYNSFNHILISLKLIGMIWIGFLSFLLSLSFDPLIKAFMSDVNQGALTQLYAATSPEIEIKNLKGAYLVPYGQVGRKSKYAQDLDGKLGEALWRLCEMVLDVNNHQE